MTAEGSRMARDVRVTGSDCGASCQRDERSVDALSIAGLRIKVSGHGILLANDVRLLARLCRCGREKQKERHCASANFSNISLRQKRSFLFRHSRNRSDDG